MWKKVFVLRAGPRSMGLFFRNGYRTRGWSFRKGSLVNRYEVDPKQCRVSLSRYALEELSGVVSAGRGNGIGIRRGDTSPSLGVLTTEMGHQLPTVIVASSTAYGESVQQLQKKMKGIPRLMA